MYSFTMNGVIRCTEQNYGCTKLMIVDSTEGSVALSQTLCKNSNIMFEFKTDFESYHPPTNWRGRKKTDLKTPFPLYYHIAVFLQYLIVLD